MYSSMSGVPPMPLTKASTLLAAGQAEVRDDRRHEPLGHVVDRRELLTAPARLAVDPDPDLDLVVAEVERRACPAAGTMHELRARPIERPWR